MKTLFTSSLLALFVSLLGFSSSLHAKDRSPPHMGPYELGVPMHFAKGENCWEYIGEISGYSAITFYGDFLASKHITASCLKERWQCV